MKVWKVRTNIVKITFKRWQRIKLCSIHELEMVLKNLFPRQQDDIFTYIKKNVFFENYEPPKIVR